MQLNANTSWFNFTSQSGDFAVYAFSGVEEVCNPYEFHIELVSRSANVDITALLGTSACLSIADRSGEKRLVHGLIREMEQLHTANVATHYRCVLVPRLRFLDQIRDHRIFQNLSVVQIIQQILQEQGFTAEATAFKLWYSYEPREYCVQYGETDLHFLTRLCEEEGIYFYFEHLEDSHCLCFSDREGGPKIPGESDVRFFPGSGQVSDTAVISRLNLRHRVNSNAATYREWNFEQPQLDLEVGKHEPDAKAAPVPSGMLLEEYNYPHLYQLQKSGSRYAELQILRQLTFRQWIECQSDVSRYMPSYTFSIHDHTRSDVNTGWWIVAVRHEGEQPGVLEHEAPSDRGLRYQSYVTAIPEMTRFIPELEHQKNLIIGDQTAIVTGPDGEEIFPDNLGRVKVQFFWDREGKWDEKTTCWIRVSQGWAGGGYGMMAIPRIGHEVIVSFLEGNPDRPIITGRVYHALNMPPYALPEHKTRMTIRSKTHRGTGYNELRFEDMQGNEQVYLHGQRDFDTLIEHDGREWIKNDRHLLVGNDRIEEVKGISSSQVDKNRMEATGGKRTVTVGEDEAHQVGGSHHLKVTGNVYIEGMTSGVLEMHKQITIKAPGGFITIDGSGITIEGKVVNLNTGGSAESGFPVQAVPARTAAFADSREAGSGHKSEAALTESTAVIRSAPEAPAPFSSIGGQNFVTEPIVSVGTGSLSSVPAAMMPLCAGILPLMRNAPIDMEKLKISEDPIAQEWRKTVLDARQESSLAGKMETVDRFFQKNIAPAPENTVSGLQGPEAVLQSGRGNRMECAVAKYHTLREAGVPADSMRIITTEQQTMLMAQNGPETLVAGTDLTPGMFTVRDAAALPSTLKPILAADAKTIFACSAD